MVRTETVTINVDFIYDFGSPNAYLCHRVIPQIEQRTGVTFNYIPCLLGGIFKATGNQAPAISHSAVKGKLQYDLLEIDRFVKKHELSNYVFNRNFPVNSLLLMRGAAVAQLEGVHDAYLEAGMRAMWEDNQNMAEPAVFVEVMKQAGLDGEGLASRCQDDDVKAKLKANTQTAVDRRVFGVPTFFVGSEIFFGKERLGQVEEEIQNQIAAKSDQSRDASTD